MSGPSKIPRTTRSFVSLSSEEEPGSAPDVAPGSAPDVMEADTQPYATEDPFDRTPPLVAAVPPPEGAAAADRMDTQPATAHSRTRALAAWARNQRQPCNGTCGFLAHSDDSIGHGSWCCTRCQRITMGYENYVGAAAHDLAPHGPRCERDPTEQDLTDMEHEDMPTEQDLTDMDIAEREARTFGQENDVDSDGNTPGHEA